MRVKRSRLGPMDPIAKGAEGQVYRLTSPSVAGAGQPLAFKELLPSLTPAHRAQAVDAMEHAVALRDAMDPADRAELDRVTTWPIAIVEEKGATVGTVMPLIPSDYFTTTNPPNGPSSTVVFEFAYLCASDTYLKNAGIDTGTAGDPLVRLALVAQLCYVLGLLHKHQIVYGDLSLKNIAIATDPPRVLLLDCDPAAALANTRRHQLHSPFFNPPEMSGKKLQDLATDVYKLGLCVLRGLVKGTGVTQLKDPAALSGVLDQAGIDLIARAVSARPADRPAAKDLYHYFERVVIAKAQPPVVATAALNRTVLLRGGDVVVTWSATGAREVRITGPNGLAIVVSDPDAHPNGYAVRPEASGDIVVQAVNRHGTDAVHAGFVDLYELPSFRISDAPLPRMRVPDLAPVEVPSVLSALPARPVVTADSHPIPRLEAPDLSRVVDALRPELSRPDLGDPFRRAIEATSAMSGTLERAHRDANARVVTTIEDALKAALQSAGIP